MHTESNRAAATSLTVPLTRVPAQSSKNEMDSARYKAVQAAEAQGHTPAHAATCAGVRCRTQPANTVAVVVSDTNGSSIKKGSCTVAAAAMEC